MPELLKKFFKFNYRVIIFVLILLFLIDLGLEQVILPQYLSPGSTVSAGPPSPIRRLPADDIGTLSLWKDQLHQGRGLKVVFLGDSVIHGGGVPEESQTIPAYFSRRLQELMPGREIQVYNFSLPGCTPADTVHMLAFLADVRPNLVIYDVNIGWFGSSRVMEHPRLAELKPLGYSGTAVKREFKDLPAWTEERLTAFVSRHWSLYRNRILLNYLLFGQPLKEKLKPGARQEKPEEDLTRGTQVYRPWYEKDFEALQESRGRLGSVKLEDSNPHLVMYRRLAAELQRRRIPAAFFMVSRNRPLLQKYDLLDESLLERQQALLARVAADRGITVYDYTFLVPDRYFTDTVHLSGGGNQILGERLATDVFRQRLLQDGK